MKKRLVSVLLALGVLFAAGVASAHVVVVPKQSTANGFERYTIRVPNEKDKPTNKVRVELPAGTTFSAVLPLPGWKFDTEKDASGKVVALDWSGGQILPGEFQEFGVSLRNPKDAGTVSFKAYQTYSDGTVVNWTGAAGADTPAPTVQLAPAAPAAAGGDEDAAPAPAPAPAPQGGTQPAVTPTAPAPAAQGGALGTWLGGGALVISLVALFLALRKR